MTCELGLGERAKDVSFQVPDDGDDGLACHGQALSGVGRPAGAGRPGRSGEQELPGEWAGDAVRVALEGVVRELEVADTLAVRVRPFRTGPARVVLPVVLPNELLSEQGDAHVGLAGTELADAGERRRGLAVTLPGRVPRSFLI